MDYIRSFRPQDSEFNQVLMSWIIKGLLWIKESTGEEKIQEIPEISAVEMNSQQNHQEKTQIPLDKDLKKVVQKTSATFAPRAFVASKNLVVPGTALYTIFEVQDYITMLLGGALSFNLIFPSNEPDIWREANGDVVHLDFQFLLAGIHTEETTTVPCLIKRIISCCCSCSMPTSARLLKE